MILLLIISIFWPKPQTQICQNLCRWVFRDTRGFTISTPIMSLLTDGHKFDLLEMFLIFSVSRHESGVTSSVKLAHKVKLQSIISSNEQVKRIPQENFRNIVLKGLNLIRTYAELRFTTVQTRLIGSNSNNQWSCYVMRGQMK